MARKAKRPSPRKRNPTPPRGPGGRFLPTVSPKVRRNPAPKATRPRAKKPGPPGTKHDPRQGVDLAPMLAALVTAAENAAFAMEALYEARDSKVKGTPWVALFKREAGALRDARDAMVKTLRWGLDYDEKAKVFRTNPAPLGERWLKSATEAAMEYRPGNRRGYAKSLALPQPIQDRLERDFVDAHHIYRVLGSLSRICEEKAKALTFPGEATNGMKRRWLATRVWVDRAWQFSAAAFGA